MIKLTFCVRRLPSLSFAEFDRYWHETHGPLVASHADLLGIRRYVQSPATFQRIGEALRTVRGSPPGFDGVAEAWYDSVEAFLEHGRDPEVKRISADIIADEARFIDLSASPLLLGEERQVLPR